MFESDKTVVPKYSSLFGEYDFTAKMETPLRERAIYKEDWLGLKKLDERGGLVFKTVRGEHMQISQKTFKKMVRLYNGI